MKIKQYGRLIWYRAVAQLKADTSRAYLGFLWWILEPILYMAAFYLLFETGLRAGGDNFVLFLLVGLVPWKWFSSTVMSGSNSLLANKGLIQQIYVPKYVFPLIGITINFLRFLIILALLLVFLLVYGVEVHLQWLALPVVVLVQALFILGATCLCAALVPLVPDIRYLIDNGMLFLLFLSGIFFSVRDFPDPVRQILLYNPVALLIENFRLVLLDGAWPAWGDLLRVVIISVLLIVAGFYLLGKYDRRYSKVIY